jgi:hypothetical protein
MSPARKKRERKGTKESWLCGEPKKDVLTISFTRRKKKPKIKSITRHIHSLLSPIILLSRSKQFWATAGTACMGAILCDADSGRVTSSLVRI